MPARIELRASEFEKLRLPGHCVHCMTETKRTSASWMGLASKTAPVAIAFPCCESCDRNRKFRRVLSIAGLCLFIIYLGIGFVAGMVEGISEFESLRFPSWVTSLGPVGLVLWLSQRNGAKHPVGFEEQDGDKITFVIYNDAFLEKMRELNPSLAMNIYQLMRLTGCPGRRLECKAALAETRLLSFLRPRLQSNFQ